jgi:3-hydroxyacyl-[acyl-carrier-protein] dehydratase
MNLKKEIYIDQIETLIPHRKPFLLIDKLTDIVPMISATGVMNIKKTDFFFNGHFPGQPVMPGVLIVEAFGQSAAALTAYSLDPVMPECELKLKVEAIRSKGKVWKYKGVAMVNDKIMADSEWMATIVDRKD